MLKISIVTVSFNQAAYLERTICSVLDQRYGNLEYIIIDGGSTDGSQAIIEKYAPQLAYWVSEKDGGMYDGLQKGLARCTGDIMAWINSDDLLHPGSLDTAAEIFGTFPQVEWLQGLPTVADEKGRTVFVKDFRKWSKYNYFLRDREHIQQESCFWRKPLWERTGGKLDTKLRYAGDYELWSRFFEHANLYCTRALLGAFRARSSGQLSLDGMARYEAEVQTVWEERMQRLTGEEKNNLEQMKPVTSASLFSRNKKVPLKKPADFAVPAIVFDRKTQRFAFE